MSYKGNETISDQIESILTSIVTETPQSEKNVHLLDDTTLQIESQIYRVVENYREGFDFEAFENRYQDYFEKFDFIVGDWGFEQLRLRGFYQLNKRKVPREQIIDNLDDYLKEYCNFGCRYFVIAKEEALLKYNQMMNGVPVKKQKKPSHPTINTKTGNELKVKNPPKVKNKSKKNENFQIKQQANKKVDKKKINSEVTKGTQPIVKNKKNFVIKQMSK